MTLLLDLGEGRLAVHPRLALPEQVEVGAVEDEYRDRHERIVPPDPVRAVKGKVGCYRDSPSLVKGEAEP
jgi:hypothetical protein